MAKRTTKTGSAAEAKAAAAKVTGNGTRAAPWTLQTPSLASEFVAFRDDQLDPPALVVPEPNHKAAIRSGALAVA